MANDKLIRAREMGQVPDRIWYQVNSESAEDNYTEQKRAQSRRFREDCLNRQVTKQEEDDEPMNIVIEGKVKK